MALVEALGSCEKELQALGKSLCVRAEASGERILQGRASSSRRIFGICSSLSCW